ncbi:MAG: hypothetical protein M3R47_02085 [Chloroflexota bacterium]|nr:hypothetical protein [Chloroflexota bacterium]
MSKHPREYYEQFPERYVIEKGGAVKDKESGRWVDSITELNPHAITPATSQSMHARRREIAKEAEIKALARAAGMDVDNATAEELAKGAGTAYEALVIHGYELAMGTKTARGFEGLFSQFRSIMAGDPKQPDSLPTPRGIIGATPVVIRELLVMLDQEINARLEKAKAIDANTEEA